MTRWVYFIVFSTKAVTHERAKEFLDKAPEVENWYTCIANTFFIVSPYTANSLTDIICERLTGGTGRFFITDVATDTNGWLPKQAWDFLNKAKEK